MARQLKAEPDQALTNAIMQFWRDGYHATGTRKLEEETGLTRFSLQTTHGGKKPFFLKALDSYLDLFETHLLPQLQRGTIEDLARWFETRPLPEGLNEQLCFGCFMVNSITEFSRADAEVNERGERYFTMLRSAFRESLSLCKQSGELPAHFDIDEGAEVLLGLATALNISFKSAAPSARPEAMEMAAANLIRSWRSSDHTEKHT